MTNLVLKSARMRGGRTPLLGPGSSRMFVASVLLHGGLLGGLAVAMATEAGKPPSSRVEAVVETPIALDAEIAPLPESGAPELPPVPAAADLELPAELAPDPGDPRIAPEAAAGEPSEGGAAPLGIGGGGLRVRPRRGPAVAAAGDGVGHGVGHESAVTDPLPAPAGPSVRARPLPDGNGEPAYPARERRLGVQGVVLLLVSVDPLGAAGGVELLESSGAVALDRAAVDAVREWRFSPALREGVPVEDSIRLRIRFSLVESGRRAVER